MDVRNTFSSKNRLCQIGKTATSGRADDCKEGGGSECLDDSREGGGSESLEHFLEHILEQLPSEIGTPQ